MGHIPSLLSGAVIHYDAPIYKILISGIPHGTGETILAYFVCMVSINWLTFWVRKLLKKESKTIKTFLFEHLYYLNKSKYIIISVLVVSSIIEVYYAVPLYKDAIGYP